MVTVVAPVGVQVPRVWCAPPAVGSLAGVAVEIAARCGLVLDPWQVFVLEHSLGVRADGQWAAFEVGVDVARQNGKGALLEARELLGLFELGEDLIIHSAHEFATAHEAFQRMEGLLEEGGLIGELKPRSGISRSHGSEGFWLRTGQRIRYRTRTAGGGRGFSCDTLIYDEAMILDVSRVGATLPTLSARPNPQVWYTGSAVDQRVHENGVVFTRLRERGHAGGDPSLAWFEWSAGVVDEQGNPLLPDALDDEALDDPVLWASANPGLGFRIRAEHIGYELRSMDPRTFAVERCGIGDWPDTATVAQTVIPLTDWDMLVDKDSAPLDPVCFAFDVSPARSSAAICAAGARADGATHVEVTDRRTGTGWLVDRLIELYERHQPAAVVCDERSPAGSLIGKLEDAGVTVQALSATEHARACGTIADLVEQRNVYHLGQAELRNALRGAKTRPLGDAWAWARVKSSIDISCLVAATLAVWATGSNRPSVYRERGMVVV